MNLSHDKFDVDKAWFILEQNERDILAEFEAKIYLQRRVLF